MYQRAINVKIRRKLNNARTVNAANDIEIQIY